MFKEKQTVLKNNICPKCKTRGSLYFQESFQGTVENPINKNGTINFKVKFLDGEAEDKRVVCNKCGFSAHVEVDQDERPVILEP